MSADPQSLKSLWQSLPSQPSAFSHEEMRRRAEEFQAKHKRRILMEYAGFAGLVGIIAFYLSQRANWEAVVASGLAIIGGLVMLWNYHRIAKVNALSASSSSETMLAYMRRELVRQRDAAATAWRWYLLPCVPFFTFVIVFRWLEEGTTILEFTQMRWAILINVAFIIAFCAAVIFWQFLSAARYQRQLDALDR